MAGLKDQFRSKIVLLAILVFFDLGMFASLRADSFEEAFRAQMAAGNPPVADLVSRGIELRTKKIVFVAGVLNEVARSNFNDSRRVLKKQYGVQDSTVIFPKSFISISDNSEALYKQFLWLHFVSGKPLVILAHSKGAAETVLALLRHPDLLRDGVVEKVYALQGALNGSYIADVINGKGNWKYWSTFVSTRMPGLLNLGTENARKVIGGAIAEASAEERAVINGRLFFIRSVENPWQSIFYMVGTNLYLTKNYGENDGVLLSQDQLLPELGTDLGVVHDIDHTDFVMSFPHSGALRRTRTAFTHTWIRYILDEVEALPAAPSGESVAPDTSP
ncbi:MAG: hypothetical protein A2X97_11690 [Bdellovibrionales bacterium GWA1_52_35]|nr:MAG: hypothetical protein A2X97_11690 [Bdellovibrionales bacterium GWA1_52_35]